MFSEFFLKQFSKADMYLDHIKLYSFFSTSHNLWVWRQNLLVQAVLAWAVGWKSMAACSEIMQYWKKLKSLKCAEYIPASENHFKKKFWRLSHGLVLVCGSSYFYMFKNSVSSADCNYIQLILMYLLLQSIDTQFIRHTISTKVFVLLS